MALAIGHHTDSGGDVHGDVSIMDGHGHGATPTMLWLCTEYKCVLKLLCIFLSIVQ